MEKEAKELSVGQAKEIAKKSAILLANRWRHRRRMAYISLFAVLYVTYHCIFNLEVERLKALNEIITWFYITMASIIGAYLGFATLDDKWKNNKQKDNEE